MTELYTFDYDARMEEHANRLDTMQQLILNHEQLAPRDENFAIDLISTFINSGALSAKQWDWVEKLNERVEGVKPLYGDFSAIQVAFHLAGEHIKFPKVRLLTEEGRYVQLNFYPETKTIKVFVDGWQGHGYRKFAGTIEDNMVKPYSRDRLTDDVYAAIETLANDPIGASKAFALKLGVCIYCGHRLSDDTSKHHGYGPICAKHYGLPYGDTKLKAVK